MVLAPVHETWLPREHSLYRPRHGSRQLVALLCAAVFFGVPLLSWVVGVRAPDIENRAKTDFPGVVDGWSFFTDMPAWATDALPYRDLAIGASDWVSRSVFGEPPSLGGRDTDTGPIAPPGGTPSMGESDRGPDGYPRVIEGSDGWLYYGLDVSAKCKPNQNLDEVLATVTRLRALVEASGRRFVLVVAPDKSTAVPEFLPGEYAGKQCSAPVTERFWQRIVGEAGAVDLRPALREEFDSGGSVYFPQDSHWTFTGGLTMAAGLAESIDPGVTRSWKTTLGPQWTDDADLPKLIGHRGQNQANQLGLAPDGGDDRSNRVDADFNRTLRFSGAPTRGTVDASVAMVADSFTQFACPYLAAAFTDISITHLETLRKSPEEVGRTLADSDVVVVQVVERHLATGLSPVSDPRTVEIIGQALAAQPR